MAARSYFRISIHTIKWEQTNKTNNSSGDKVRITLIFSTDTTEAEKDDSKYIYYFNYQQSEMVMLI